MGPLAWPHATLNILIENFYPAENLGLNWKLLDRRKEIKFPYIEGYQRPCESQ